MTLRAREVKPVNRAGHYKIKEIDVPLDAQRAGCPPEWILTCLEGLHEPEWEVCGVTMAGNGRGVWVFYRRVGLVSTGLH